jgi:hypothetical protein
MVEKLDSKHIGSKIIDICVEKGFLMVGVDGDKPDKQGVTLLQAGDVSREYITNKEGTVTGSIIDIYA